MQNTANNLIKDSDIIELEYIMKYFDDINLNRKGVFMCKTYSICKCAYETSFIIDEGSKFFLQILFENNNISDMLIIKKRILINKYYHLLPLKTKKEYEDFNKKGNSIKKIKILSEIAQRELEKIM